MDKQYSVLYRMYSAWNYIQYYVINHEKESLPCCSLLTAPELPSSPLLNGTIALILPLRHPSFLYFSNPFGFTEVMLLEYFYFVFFF